MASHGLKRKREAFRSIERPEIALVTNHGYGGPNIPVGGAPDTGGQNKYVNTLASKLDALGYKVTIFARGGFPHFESHRIRRKTEHVTDYVRYVYVPGGGEQFLNKEDIAIALDEQLDWLEEFCRTEAEARGCEPWELYEFVNTHYWDAAVLGVGLIERWQGDIVEGSLKRLLDGVVSESVFEELNKGLRWRALDSAPDFYLGRLLIYHVGEPQWTIEQQVRAAATLWASARAVDATAENRIVDKVLAHINRKDVHLDPRYERLVAASALGREILAGLPDRNEQLKRALARADRHVWTPHSLGELKDYNFRDQSLDVRRSLKFCERRNHERMICQRTHAFAATSAKIGERLWTHYRVPVEDTFYFPPCVDSDIFRQYTSKEVQPTYRWLSEATGLCVDELERGTLVFETSRMDRTKRKDLLLAGFARLAKKHPDSYLLIGGGPPNELFESLQDQLNYTKSVAGHAFLLGAIPEEHIGPLFSIADVYATASEMEGFGMSVSQAAAAGTPIVSTDTIPFSIHHAAEHALLFSPGDIDAFVAQLGSLLEDPKERKRRGDGAKATLDGLDWLKRTMEFLAYLKRRGFDICEGSRKHDRR